jgi:Mg2+ and Co2+ transporter CorA
MRKIVPDYWRLPDSLRAKLGERAGRQRALFEQGHSILVLHKVPRGHERGRHAVVFWRTPEQEWRTDPGTDSIQSLAQHVEAYATALEELDDRVEEARRATEYFEILNRARPLVRATRNMNAAIGQLREQCGVNAEPELLAIRDRAYEVERLADGVAADAENGMDFMVAQHAEETAEISVRIASQSHRLNMLAAICLPVTALGAILGMNLTNGLEALPEPITFWLIVLAAFGLGYYIRKQVQKAG